MNKKILLLVVWGLILSSCSDWLDVSPKESIVEADLFKEATGFQNSLNGIYEQMASTELYGRELTYGMIDAMGQVYCLQGENYYNIKRYHYYYQAAKFEYDANDDIKNAFNSIWSMAYNTIANCNNIINHIDVLKPEDFRLGEAERQMIKGEALAARAMLHFDLLRIFAPAPASKPSGIYIPYVTDFPYYGGQVALSVEETMKKIETDLLAAKGMVMGYDTLNLANRSALATLNRFVVNDQTGISASGDGSSVERLPFYHYRGYRINGLAVTALLARFYSYWGGDKYALAAENARFVAKFSPYVDETLAFTYEGNKVSTDRKFTKDLIFCLSYPKLQLDYDEYAVTTSNSCLTISKYNTIWQYDFADNGDQRLKLIKDDYGDYMPLKNIRPDGSDELITTTEDMVPMIRLSEMHFILAEYYASIGDFPNAAENIKNVRVGRNCKGDVDLGITDMTTFKSRLLGEVRREFFQEGQTFFYYKKYGEKFTTGMNPDSFVFPKPDSENVN